MAQLKKASLCKWKRKDLASHFNLLSELTQKPEFLCLKCGRAANKKRNLCKATPIAKD